MAFVTPQVPHVERLPNELLIMVFDKLDAPAVARASRVSHRWNACAADERQWREHFSEYTGRPLDTLRFDIPAPSTWRAFYNTLANVHWHEARATALLRDANRAELRARAAPDWLFHGRMAGRYFTQGITSAFNLVLSPILVGGAAASSATGLALGVGGITTGLALGLLGVATSPFIGESGLIAGAVIAIGGVRSGVSLQEVAINCLLNSIVILTRSLGLVLSNELQALGQALTTVVEIGECGYHATIRGPRAMAQAAEYTTQRDRLLGQLPQLRAVMDQNEALLKPPEEP